MSIDEAIRVFARFLDNSWDVTNQLLVERSYTSDEASISDWLQCNWELLVERKVLKIGDYLEVYGEGADFNGASSRITDPDCLPNFRIKVVPRIGQSIFDILNEEEVFHSSLIFDRLIGFRNGFYNLETEFQFTLVNDETNGVERVMKLNDVEFVLEELK